MKTAAGKTTRRKARPAAESVVYDGSKLLGTVSPRRGGFAPRLVSGRRLGAFASEQLAMKAITAAARAPLEVSGVQR